jgi:hypothetical protein
VLTEGASLDYIDIIDRQFVMGVAATGIKVLFSVEDSFLAFEFLIEIDFFMGLGFFGRGVGEFEH